MDRSVGLEGISDLVVQHLLCTTRLRRGNPTAEATGTCHT